MTPLPGTSCLPPKFRLVSLHRPVAVPLVRQRNRTLNSAVRDPLLHIYLTHPSIDCMYTTPVMYYPCNLLAHLDPTLAHARLLSICSRCVLSFCDCPLYSTCARGPVFPFRPASSHCAARHTRLNLHPPAPAPPSYTNATQRRSRCLTRSVRISHPSLTVFQVFARRDIIDLLSHRSPHLTPPMNTRPRARRASHIAPGTPRDLLHVQDYHPGSASTMTTVATAEQTHPYLPAALGTHLPHLGPT